MTDHNSLDDDTLRSRVSLATEIILTSGTIQAEDVERGWYDAPDPTDEMQRAVVLLAITVILGGLDSVPAEAIVDAWRTPRILTAAIEAMLDAVDAVRSEAA